MAGAPPPGPTKGEDVTNASGVKLAGSFELTDRERVVIMLIFYDQTRYVAAEARGLNHVMWYFSGYLHGAYKGREWRVLERLTEAWGPEPPVTDVIVAAVKSSRAMRPTAPDSASGEGPRLASALCAASQPVPPRPEGGTGLRRVVKLDVAAAHSLLTRCRCACTVACSCRGYCNCRERARARVEQHRYRHDDGRMGGECLASRGGRRKCLGKGTFGVVYGAVDTRSRKPVAFDDAKVGMKVELYPPVPGSPSTEDLPCPGTVPHQMSTSEGDVRSCMSLKSLHNAAFRVPATIVAVTGDWDGLPDSFAKWKVLLQPKYRRTVVVRWDYLIDYKLSDCSSNPYYLDDAEIARLAEAGSFFRDWTITSGNRRNGDVVSEPDHKHQVITEAWWNDGAKVTTRMQRVAVKILSSDLHRYDEDGKPVSMRERLFKEAAVMLMLRHENVVRLESVVYNPLRDELWFVMERVMNSQGPGLKSILRRCDGHRMPEVKTRGIFHQLMYGVNYMHGQKIAHRDLKPDNILISGDGVLKIVDFGLGAVQNTDTLGNVGKDMELKTGCGTMMYMAPEQFVHWKNLNDDAKYMARNGCEPQYDGGYNGFRVDIWAMGAILFEMLAGRSAFGSTRQGKEAPAAIYWKITTGTYSFPDGVVLSDACKASVRRILDINPETRPRLTQITRYEWILPGFEVRRLDSDPEQVEVDPAAGQGIQAQLDEWHAEGREAAEQAGPAGAAVLRGGVRAEYAAFAAAQAARQSADSCEQVPLSPKPSPREKDGDAKYGKMFDPAVVPRGSGDEKGGDAKYGKMFDPEVMPQGSGDKKDRDAKFGKMFDPEVMPQGSNDGFVPVQALDVVAVPADAPARVPADPAERKRLADLAAKVEALCRLPGPDPEDLDHHLETRGLGVFKHAVHEAGFACANDLRQATDSELRCLRMDTEQIAMCRSKEENQLALEKQRELEERCARAREQDAPAAGQQVEEKQQQYSDNPIGALLKSSVGSVAASSQGDTLLLGLTSEERNSFGASCPSAPGVG